MTLNTADIVECLSSNIPDVVDKINEEFYPGVVRLKLWDIVGDYNAYYASSRVEFLLISLFSISPRSIPIRGEQWSTYIAIPVGPFDTLNSPDLVGTGPLEEFLRRRIEIIERELVRYLESLFI